MPTLMKTHLRARETGEAPASSATLAETDAEATGAEEFAVDDDSAVRYETEDEFVRALMADEAAGGADAEDADDAQATETEEDDADDDAEADAAVEPDTTEDATDAEDSETEDDDEAAEPEDAEKDTEDDADEALNLDDFPKDQRDKVRKFLAQVVAREKGKVLGKLKAEKAARGELKTRSQQAAEALKEAQGQLTALRAQRVVPMPTPDNPFTAIQTEAEADAAEQAHYALEEWLEDHPEGGQCDNPLVCREAGKPVEIDPERVAELAKRVKRNLRHLPARRKYLAEQAQADAALKQVAPSALEAGTPLAGELGEVLASFPQVKVLPGHKLAALYFALGRKLVGAKGAQLEQFLEELERGPTGAGSRAETPEPVKKKPAKRIQPKPVPAMRGHTPVKRKQAAGSREVTSINSDEELVAALM